MFSKFEHVFDTYFFKLYSVVLAIMLGFRLCKWFGYEAVVYVQWIFWGIVALRVIPWTVRTFIKNL